MERIYSPSALYPQTSELQLQLGTAATSRKSLLVFLCVVLPNHSRVSETQEVLSLGGCRNVDASQSNVCVCVCDELVGIASRGGGGGLREGHVMPASNHERQVQVLVAACVCEKPEKAEVKAIKCAKCCKTAHNRQRCQQFRQRLDASACRRGEETLVIGQRRRVQHCDIKTAKVAER